MKTEPAPKYSIAEVSDLVGVKAHVLRYWETEFPQLNPEKTGSGQRVYRQKHVDIALRIRRLMHEELYTINGARKRLEDDLKEARRGQMALELGLEQGQAMNVVVKARRQVKALLDQLEKPLGLEGEGA